MVVAKESETDRIYLISINDSTWIQIEKKKQLTRTKNKQKNLQVPKLEKRQLNLQIKKNELTGIKNEKTLTYRYQKHI